jgi:hypothetical protein
MATPPVQVAEFVRGILGRGSADLEGLDDRRMADLVPALVGAGPGLTPLGDDLLAGWLATARAAGAPTPLTDAALRPRLAATTLLSATLLDCAQHGEVLPELGAWLGALGTPEEGARLARLRAIGATSGAGIAEGARLALLSLSLAPSTSSPAEMTQKVLT